MHFRGSPRPDHALRYLETQIVPKLDRAGLAWSFGRMVLEVRPPVAIDKGSAVRRLRGRRRITNLLYVGDDRTDLDAFREATIKIAVRSAGGAAGADRAGRRRGGRPGAGGRLLQACEGGLPDARGQAVARPLLQQLLELLPSCGC